MKSLYRHLTVLSALVCILLILSGCNHDVFVDGSEMIGDISVSIDGDGGEAKIEIPLKGLEHFRIEQYAESPYLTYYDARGDIVDYQSPALEISSIVYDNDLSKFEILRSGSTVLFRSVSNSWNERTWAIRLTYDYGVRYIYVHVGSGKPIELVQVTYQPDIEISRKVVISPHHSGFENNGPIAQVFQVMPFVNAMASITVEPAYSESWVKALEVDMPVPVYEDGVWAIRMQSGIRPGMNYTYRRPDYKDTVDVDVPAWSKINVFTDLTFSHAECHGEMVFLNPVLVRRLTVEFTAYSSYPVSYELRVEDAK